MKKLILGTLAIMVLSGCGSFNQAYRHKETGQISNCSSWGFGWLGLPIAYLTYQDCKASHEKAGYIPADEIGR